MPLILDPVQMYNEKIRQSLAIREAAAAEKRAQESQNAALLGKAAELGGAYAARKYAPSLVESIFGGGTSAAAAPTTTGIVGLPSVETGVPVLEALGPTNSAAAALPEAAATPFMGIGALPAAAIAGATYLGGKSLYDMLQGNEDKSLMGKVGRGTLGIATGGLSELGRFLLGNQDKWQTEGNKLKDLKEQGFSIPQNLLDAIPTRGRSNDELINKAFAPDFIGFTPTKDWVNNKFATSRQEGDLRPEDVVNYGSLAEKFGKDYFNIPLEKRLAAVKLGLDANVFDEHHGTIDFNENLTSDLESKMREYLAGSIGPERTKTIGNVKINFK